MTARTSAADGRTLWAGTLLVLAAVAVVLDRTGASLYVDDTYAYPFDGVIARRIAAGLLLLGFVVLAFVRRGGRRITAGAPVARIALVAFAAFEMVNAVVVGPTIEDPQTRSLVAVALRFVSLAAGLYAAVAVARAGVVDAWTSRLLFVAVGAQLLLSVLLTVPVLVLLQIGVALWPLWPASLAGFGVALLLDGRGAAIRRRAAIVRSNW